MEHPFQLPLPIKDPSKQISRETHPIKPLWSNANLKTGPLQGLLKKRPNLKIIRYAEEYDRLWYLKYQEAARFDKTLQVAKSKNKFIKSIDIVLTERISLGDAEFQDFSVNLRKQYLLKSLCIEFRDCEVGDGRGISNFGSFLKGLSSLQSLVLQIERSVVIQEGAWRSLRRGLEMLPGLKYFWLYFSCQEPADNEAFQEIGLSLKKLPALQSLTLILSGNNATAQGIVHLTENFQYLKSLKSLNLNLGYSARVKEYGFISLTMNLQDLLNLENLTLQLSGCRWITNLLFLHLTNTIMGFQNLQDFTLFVNGFQKVTGEEIQNFRKKVQRHPTIKRLRIN